MCQPLTLCLFPKDYFSFYYEHHINCYVVVVSVGLYGQDLAPTMNPSPFAHFLSISPSISAGTNNSSSVMVTMNERFIKPLYGLCLTIISIKLPRRTHFCGLSSRLNTFLSALWCAAGGAGKHFASQTIEICIILPLFPLRKPIHSQLVLSRLALIYSRSPFSIINYMLGGFIYFCNAFIMYVFVCGVLSFQMGFMRCYSTFRGAPLLTHSIIEVFFPLPPFIRVFACVKPREHFYDYARKICSVYVWGINICMKEIYVGVDTRFTSLLSVNKIVSGWAREGVWRGYAWYKGW